MSKAYSSTDDTCTNVDRSTIKSKITFLVILYTKTSNTIQSVKKYNFSFVGNIFFLQKYKSKHIISNMTLLQLIFQQKKS